VIRDPRIRTIHVLSLAVPKIREHITAVDDEPPRAGPTSRSLSAPDGGSRGLPDLTHTDQTDP
jgi:hypothetical protein